MEGWKGGVEEGGVGDGFFLGFDQKRQLLCMHKQPQFTCQADTVTNSSLTPSVAIPLSVHPGGTIRTDINLQGHKNDASESRPGYFKLYSWCVWIVQECDFHVKPLFVFQFLQDCSVFFANPVTDYHVTKPSAMSQLIYVLPTSFSQFQPQAMPIYI